MKPSRPRTLRALALVCATGLGASAASAGEIGHYAPGVPNIRDFAMPAPGLYAMLYTYGYSSDRVNDRNGDQIDSVTIRPGPGPGLELGLDIDVDMMVLAPTYIWVSPWTIGGARYGAYVTPVFANTSLSAALTNATGAGRSVETSHFDHGDLFVQPLWLGWAKPKLDLALGYGFYAPVGHYETESLTLPVVGPVTVEGEDNIGYGFWTHQFQGSASWYPWQDRRMAVVSALTYEIHGDKDGFDLTPGDTMTLNWGVSQYLPLKSDHSLLLEVGPAGYSSWQTTDDTGSDARNPEVHDEVHAAGGQLGVTFVQWKTSVNFHYFYEYAAEDHFAGHSIGLNFAKKFR
jgi:hypothetical protein